MIREAKSLTAQGLVDHVAIVAIHTKGQAKVEAIGNTQSVIRVGLLMRKLPSNPITTLLAYVEFALRVLTLFVSRKYAIINLHSLHVLPLALPFRLMGKKVIYDAHELETEVNGSVGIKRLFAKIVERLFVPFVHRIIVVSGSIEKWYRQEYPKKEVYTVRNISDFDTLIEGKSGILRARLNLKEDDVLFIYQGILAPWRGVNLLLNAFMAEKGNKHLVLMGMGPMEAELKEWSSRNSNIHYVPAVRPDQIAAYTCDADVGLSLIMNTCLSYYYCLPNKVYEYILTGLPIVVSDFPDMGEVVRQYDLGWCINPDQQSISQFVQAFDNQAYRAKRENVVKSRANFSWKEEAKVYKKIYAGY